MFTHSAKNIKGDKNGAKTVLVSKALVSKLWCKHWRWHTNSHVTCERTLSVNELWRKVYKWVLFRMMWKIVLRLTALLPAHLFAEGDPEVKGQGHFLDMDEIFFYRHMYFCCGQYIGSSSMFQIDISSVDKFQQQKLHFYFRVLGFNCMFVT